MERLYGKYKPISKETQKVIDDLYEKYGQNTEKKQRLIAYDVSSDQKVINQDMLFAGATAINESYMLRNTHKVKLSNGETISIPADRLWGSSKYVPKKFLGQEAHFPLGPFQIVTIREVDALIVHVMKESHMKYRVYITSLHYDKNASRKEQIEELITGYVNELERIISLYPTQWYNYFDFWAQ